MVPTIFAEQALLPQGWARNVAISIGADGTIASVKPGADPAGLERVRGPVLPGMVNLHSHAFQRAMAGLTEVAIEDSDLLRAPAESLRLAANVGESGLGGLLHHIAELAGGCHLALAVEHLHFGLQNAPAHLRPRKPGDEAHFGFLLNL